MASLVDIELGNRMRLPLRYAILGGLGCRCSANAHKADRVHFISELMHVEGPCLAGFLLVALHNKEPIAIIDMCERCINWCNDLIHAFGDNILPRTLPLSPKSGEADAFRMSI
jgi:hypothetical protein